MVDTRHADLLSSADFLACGIDVTELTGHGRAILARRSFAPHEPLLISHADLCVRQPLQEQKDLQATYYEVIRICNDIPSDFAPRLYWAALCALAPCDVPGTSDHDKSIESKLECGATPWELPPPLPYETQARIFQLCLPGAGARSQDRVASVLVQRLALRCSPLKIQDLAMVFKYNSFVAGDSGLDVCLGYRFAITRAIRIAIGFVMSMLAFSVSLPVRAGLRMERSCASPTLTTVSWLCAPWSAVLFSQSPGSSSAHAHAASSTEASCAAALAAGLSGPT